MNCVLHNEACIKSRRDLNLAKEFISRQMDNIEVLACGPAVPCAMDLFFSCNREDKYLLYCLLNLDGHENHMQEEGENIIAVLQVLFSRLETYLQKEDLSIPRETLHSKEMSNKAS